MTSIAVSPAIRRWRIALVVIGLALLALGGVVLLNDVNPKRYLGIAAWFLGALIIHDGIISFGVFGVNIAMRKAGKRVPLPVLLILQGAAVVGALMALIVVPEIMKKSIGTGNATLLPLDYASNLGWFYVVLAVVTAVVIAVYLAVARGRARAQAHHASRAGSTPVA
jgi:hypothetical protein